MEALLIALTILAILVISICCVRIYKTKSATRNLIISLGGIEAIYFPLVSEISRVFVCDNISFFWNRVILSDAPAGASKLKSDITFRLRRTLFSYVITYTSSGKSLPTYNKTWTFSDKTSLDQIWHTICKDIGIRTGIQPNILSNAGNNYKAKTNSCSELPDITNRTVKFNFLYSFKILPQSIEEYIDGKKEYIDVMSPSNIPHELEELFYKIDVSTSTLQSDPEIEINALKVPSDGGIGEVHTLLFIRNRRTRFSKLYSLEFSLDGDFCICGISSKEHRNYGIYNKSQFMDFCVSNFTQTQGNSSVQVVSVTPLLEFAKHHGRMKVTKELTNPHTGEKFKSCAFIDASGKVTLVGFSTTIGELTPSQISEQKNLLQVVELSNGVLKLTRKSENS
ncbi:MAG: hypothetical protein K2I31_04880 [Duncaniella sp.]|nr:hypothetical protein [Duncaniella sp.]